MVAATASAAAAVAVAMLCLSVFAVSQRICICISLWGRGRGGRQQRRTVILVTLHLIHMGAGFLQPGGVFRVEVLQVVLPPSASHVEACFTGGPKLDGGWNLLVPKPACGTRHNCREALLHSSSSHAQQMSLPGEGLTAVEVLADVETSPECHAARRRSSDDSSRMLTAVTLLACQPSLVFLLDCAQELLRLLACFIKSSTIRGVAEDDRH
mmetsp:Transcript_25266/g.54990  ORF Transcript_25266/g.54990 Transcript_25266/m.54990 type:complete len:211 (-) Transcript_25266:1175-1807(-)